MMGELVAWTSMLDGTMVYKEPERISRCEAALRVRCRLVLRRDAKGSDTDLSGASSKRASSIEVGVWEGRKGSSQELSRLKSPRRVGVVVGDNFLEVREGLARPCAAEGAKVVKS